MIEYFEHLKKQWFPVLKSLKLKKKPVRVQLLNEHIVLFRTSKQISALKDRCPHRNVPLSGGRVIEGCIQCPYHGWRFNTSGICDKIPGSNPSKECRSYKVQSYDVVEKAGLIWIQMKSSQDNSEPKVSKYIESKSYSTNIWLDEVDANLMNALENFLDGTHTHFVHSGVIRSEGKRKKIIAEITPTSNGVEIIYKNEGNQNGIISRLFEPERYESKASFIKPCEAKLEYLDRKGVYFTVSAYLVPETDARLKIFALISHRKSLIPSFIKHFVTYPFFKTVLAQDKKILITQQECIERFGNESFIVTDLDLMRPYIHKLLLGQDISKIPASSKIIYL